MIVLLFAEIQGGPKTKQAASDSGAALGQNRGRLYDLKRSYFSCEGAAAVTGLERFSAELRRFYRREEK